MYHDQGLIPLKLLHFDDGVNVTLGLPIIRTSVDHGTAYDLAGTGTASARSMMAAIRMAAEMAQLGAGQVGESRKEGLRGLIEAQVFIKTQKDSTDRHGLLVLYVVYIGVSLYLLPPVAKLANRRYNMIIQVKDWKGNYHPFIVGPKNAYWTPSGSIPPEMKWAVIVAEDAGSTSTRGSTSRR